MELVDIEPVRMKKVTDEQRALLCRYSSMKPPLYCKAINQIRANREQQSFEQDPFVAAWNLNVDAEMISAPARVLPMPDIVYDKQYQVKSKNVRDLGTWELTRSTKFHKPTIFPKVWAMINLSSLDRDACVEFYHELSIIAEQRGIDCPPPEIYEEKKAEYYSVNRIVIELEEMMNRNEDCQFILVILPKSLENKTRIYGHLKKLVKETIVYGTCNDQNGLF
jgi:hypothetical protein